MKRSLQTGFVLLYAVLVASVVALGGALLADIILKQLILSSIGRESQFAYYAATAGEECARYQDNNNPQDPFGRNLPGRGSRPPTYLAPDTTSFNCNGGEIVVNEIELDSSHGKFSFVLNELDRGACAKVIVTKGVNLNPKLVIESRGYNQGDPSCGGESPRRIEKLIIRSSNS